MEPRWKKCSLCVISLAKIFWYEFCSLIVRQFLWIPWDDGANPSIIERICPPCSRGDWYRKVYSGTAFLLRVYHTRLSLHKWRAVLASVCLFLPPACFENLLAAIVAAVTEASGFPRTERRKPYRSYARLSPKLPSGSEVVENVISAVQILEIKGGRILVAPFNIAIGKCAVIEDPFGTRICILDMTRGPLKPGPQ